MEYHEIANIFPLMEGTELTELSADIKKNGLIDPIWLYENKILDGRNRYRACQEVGVEPRFQSYPGNDPLQYVISLNLHRRHLNESQRAVVAARLANMQVGDNQYSGSANMPTLSQSQAAKMLNVSERMVRTVKAIEREAPERLSEINSGKETATKIYKLIKRAEPPTENIPLPSGVYDVIYADPPWEYKNAGFSMSAANQYPTMPIEDLKTMAIKDISATDSVLFLWATNPQLKDALELIDAWGFEYKTNFVWEKSNHTAGFYVYGQHELLLIAVRGSMLPTGKKFKSIIQGENKKHSKKPEVVYGIIEQMYPASKYIELFAREPRSGWKSWGNEIE